MCYCKIATAFKWIDVRSCDVDIEESASPAYLDDLGADLEGAGTELLARAVGVLPVHHADIGTAPGGNHLRITEPDIEHHESAQVSQPNQDKNKQVKK